MSSEFPDSNEREEREAAEDLANYNGTMVNNAGVRTNPADTLMGASCVVTTEALPYHRIYPNPSVDYCIPAVDKYGIWMLEYKFGSPDLEIGRINMSNVIRIEWNNSQVIAAHHIEE